jgi:hypothetical protein
MSVRFILFTPNHFEEFAKNIMRIMRTRRGLGMELDAKDWFVLYADSFK